MVGIKSWDLGWWERSLCLARRNCSFIGIYRRRILPTTVMAPSASAARRDRMFRKLLSRVVPALGVSWSLIHINKVSVCQATDEYLSFVHDAMEEEQTHTAGRPAPDADNDDADSAEFHKATIKVVCGTGNPDIAKAIGTQLICYFEQ